jgi:hypothetical protein
MTSSHETQEHSVDVDTDQLLARLAFALVLFEPRVVSFKKRYRGSM